MDIKDELKFIRKSMEELHTELTQTKGELRKLRLVIQNKKREKPKDVTLTSPMWCYEWNQMVIDLDSKTWKKIKDGELVTSRGRGNSLDEPLPDGEDYFQWDFWTFNKEWKGSVIVQMAEPNELPNSPDVAYRGDLEYLDIEEREVERVSKK